MKGHKWTLTVRQLPTSHRGQNKTGQWEGRGLKWCGFNSILT